MERKGLVTSFRGEPTPERGGRGKRYYAIAAPGVEALNRSRDVIDRMWDGLGAPVEA